MLTAEYIDRSALPEERFRTICAVTACGIGVDQASGGNPMITGEHDNMRDD